MPRLFTAIELPEQLRLRLSLLGAPMPGARWLEASDIHLTLRFVGDISGREADAFAAELAAIEHAPFPIRLTGLGFFGGREPRAIWAGVEPNPSLDQLQRLNDRAARTVGLAAEPRPFRPHVTLARLKGTRTGHVARYLEEQGHFASEPFVVSRFVLLSAKPGTGGGPYAVEAEYPLEPLGPDDTQISTAGREGA